MKTALFPIIFYVVFFLTPGLIFIGSAKAVNLSGMITVTARVDETIGFITKRDITTISTNSPTGFILLGDNVYVCTLHPDNMEIESPNQTFYLSANY